MVTDRFESYEKLRGVGVASKVGHRNDSFSVMAAFRRNLVPEFRSIY